MTRTVIVVGVNPLDGDAVSQAAFDLTMNAVGAPAKPTDCSAVLCVVKLNVEGVAVIAGAAAIVNVTATVCVPLIVRTPLYVPAASPDGLTLTLTDAGVTPFDGLAVSQAALDVSVNASAVLVLEIETG